MTLLARLNALLGESGVVSSPQDMSPFLLDERRLYRGSAACLVFPRTTQEVAGVIRLCDELGYTVVPQGGNTGYCGGATPMGERQVLMNLSKMNRVRCIDPVGMTATVEAGVILADLQQAAREQDLFFPVSMGSEGSCQVGGNLATNAGGLAVLKYGTAGEQMLGLEVVLASGDVLDLLKPLRKDNTGYHLEQLFLGAEGSLGIITAATLRLFPAPTEYQTAWLAVADIESACRLLPLARSASGDTVTSLEYLSGPSLDLVLNHVEGTAAPLGEGFPHQLLLELSAPLPPGALRERLEALLTQALESGLALDAVIAESDHQRKKLWHIRESLPEAEKRAGRSIKHDVSVAIDRIPEYLARAPGRLAGFPGARTSIYGHLGDGNLHYNVLAPEGEDADAYRAAHAAAISAALHDLAAELGGSFSAEHGVGQLKTAELVRYTDPVALALMKTLKRSLDPRSILNPGKVIDR
jgi:D-lactate dehydrogenase (cytochrome)